MSRKPKFRTDHTREEAIRDMNRMSTHGLTTRPIHDNTHIVNSVATSTLNNVSLRKPMNLQANPDLPYFKPKFKVNTLAKIRGNSGEPRTVPHRNSARTLERMGN